MADWSFRYPFRLAANMKIEATGSEFTLSEPDSPQSVYIRSTDGSDISDAREFVLRGSGFPSEADARVGGDRWFSALVEALALSNLGADFGLRAPQSWATQSVLDSHATAEHPVVLLDRQGLMVFPSQPAPLLVKLDPPVPIVGKGLERIRDAVLASISAGVDLAPSQRLAFDFYSSSFQATSADARLVTLVSAVEALLDPQPRAAEVQAVVQQLITTVDESGLAGNEVSSLKGSLKWMLNQSIGQAGTTTLAERLGGRKYLDEPAPKFFSRCYRLRSKLVHGLQPPPTWREVFECGGELERMVGDLIASDLVHRFDYGPHTRLQGYVSDPTWDGGPDIPIIPLNYVPEESMQPVSPVQATFDRQGDRLIVQRAGTATIPLGEPLIWLDTMTPEGSTEPAKVMLFERQGNQVLVRQLDPGEERAEPVPLFDGDEVRLMLAISHVSTFATDVVGSVDDLFFSLRAVPVRQEPGRVIARTLRLGEEDTGARVHVRPGDDVVFAEGGVVVELDYLDTLEPPTESGHVPLTPVLAMWFAVGSSHDEVKVRYLMAAARRLDAADQLLLEVQRRRTFLQQDGLIGPDIRRKAFELLSSVELAVVALWRAVDMVLKASVSIACSIPVPTQVSESQPALKAIRDAYEHIEDRALGQVFSRPDPHALTIFDQRRLLDDGVLAYGTYQVGVVDEAPAVIAAVRQFLKAAAAGA